MPIAIRVRRVELPPPEPVDGTLTPPDFFCGPFGWGPLGFGPVDISRDGSRKGGRQAPSGGRTTV